MATLNSLNQRFLQRLQDAVPDNLDRYKQDEAWIEDWAETRRGSCQRLVKLRSQLN